MLSKPLKGITSLVATSEAAFASRYSDRRHRLHSKACESESSMTTHSLTEGAPVSV
jgi:hypothetical protein